LVTNQTLASKHKYVCYQNEIYHRLFFCNHGIRGGGGLLKPLLVTIKLQIRLTKAGFIRKEQAVLMQEEAMYVF
jgi:hypothetical protein